MIVSQSTRKNDYFYVLHCIVKSTAALWAQVNKVWAEADKVWAEADRLTQETPERILTPGEHTVRFTAKTFRARLRLAGQFIRLSVTVLCTGQTRLRFKYVKSPVETHAEKN